MNHSEAVDRMIAERYLLDELDADERDAFEEHLFDCPECALEVRAGTAFVSEAKTQLPAIAAGPAAASQTATGKQKQGPRFSWWSPVFAAPVFAALLTVVAYQNFVTVSALKRELSQPHIVPSAPSYGATRGSAPVPVTADSAHGVALPVDISIDPAVGNFAVYSFALAGPQGNVVWTGTIAAPAQEPNGDLQLSVVVPGKLLENGSYSLAVEGVGTRGDRTAIGQYGFDITLNK